MTFIPARNPSHITTLPRPSPSPQEASALQDLHDRILACDGVLAEVEVVLQRFQSDLGSISGQIRALQEQSASLR